MRTLVALPDHQFYLWQMLVQIQHFQERGELGEVDYLLYHSGKKPSDKARAIADGTGARLHFWRDPRHQFDYNPMMKPWLIARYLEKYPEQRVHRFHYVDPDVMFTQPADFYDQAPSWAGSPTDSYTGPGYLRSHGEDLWNDLCAIAGVPSEAAARVPGAGAQWVVADTDAQFWDDVSETSLKMFHRCLRQKQAPGQQFKVQAWCAEMYATQLVALAYGFPVYPDPALAFLWANGPAADWDNFGYFHNAGLPVPNGIDFCKGEHQVSPFRKNLYVDPGSASYHYLKLVQRTEQNWPELIW